MDAAHFLSAGTVSFARGLNDTPKIVALLLLWKALNPERFQGWAFIAVALTMAIGGVLNARRGAETKKPKKTPMNHGQGCTFKLSTPVLSVVASQFGLSPFTAHVSLGSLFA